MRGGVHLSVREILHCRLGKADALLKRFKQMEPFMREASLKEGAEGDEPI
jgi:hypothetical protein